MRFAICLFVASSTPLALASGPPLWRDGWEVDVSYLSCEMKASHTAAANKAESPLYETAFTGMTARFRAFTRTNRGRIPSGQLGRISFSLSVYKGLTQPHRESELVGATIGRFNAQHYVTPKIDTHQFMLNETESIAVYEIVKNAEKVEISLHFDDGRVRKFITPTGAHSLKNAGVLAAMFETCIRENRG